MRCPPCARLSLKILVACGIWGDLGVVAKVHTASWRVLDIAGMSRRPNPVSGFIIDRSWKPKSKKNIGNRRQRKRHTNIFFWPVTPPVRGPSPGRGGQGSKIFRKRQKTRNSRVQEVSRDRSRIIYLPLIAPKHSKQAFWELRSPEERSYRTQITS